MLYVVRFVVQRLKECVREILIQKATEFNVGPLEEGKLPWLNSDAIQRV
jgi:hypothetical protein